MPKYISAIAFILILILGFASPVQAATPRSTWVENEIYQYNHPFASQLPQELATKMQKMKDKDSPFAFYRGTAHIFYRDMQTLPSSRFVNSSTSAIWLEGDMHLQNLGGIRDSNDNNVFDTTDFDESYLGPYVWDLRRMAVSILLAAKENALSSSDAQDIVRNFLDAYLNKMSDFKGSNDELSYRLESSNTNGVVKDLIQKTSNNSRSRLLSKYTQLNNSNNRVFKTSSELQPVSNSTYSDIAGAISNYITSIPSSKRYNNSYYTLKDTFEMGHIAANTPEMVRKLIWSHLLAYNVLRWHMLNASSLFDTDLEHVSVTAAATVISANAVLIGTTKKQALPALFSSLYSQIVQVAVGIRPGRIEPRAVKKRPKPSRYLKEKRSAWHGRQSA